MQPADDPRLAELQEKLAGITVGDPASCEGRLGAVRETLHSVVS